RIVQEHRNDVETSLIRRRRSRRALGNANVVKLIVRERLSRVAPHALRLADEEFEPPFGVLADCVEVTSHVSIKRCILTDQEMEVGSERLPKVRIDAIDDVLILGCHHLPWTRRPHGRSGFPLGRETRGLWMRDVERWIEGWDEDRVVLGPILIEEHMSD